jgi:predicted peptidase
MYFLRRFVVFVHGRALELLLLLAIIVLVVQLSWPAVVRWCRLPRPGKVGLDQFDSPVMASNYLIYLPDRYGGTKEWPLVVFLHGSGERGTDSYRLRKLKVLNEKLPAIVVVPQCLPTSSWGSSGVAGMIESVAARYKVNRTRIYLIGFSMGGAGTWQTAAEHPELFAAIVPISGGGDPSKANALRRLPIWAFHGANDTTVPIKESQQMTYAVRAAGGQPKLTIIPAAGHGICNLVLGRTDLWQWLFEQQRQK